MIERRSIRNKDAHRLVVDAIKELTLRVPHAGLTLLGSTIRIHEAAVGTLMTDGRRVYYDPDWILSKTRRDHVFDLLHEWLHIFYNHPARCGDRDRDLWRTAIDVIVVRDASLLLSTPGDHWPYPTDGIIPPDWAKDMTAEQVYDELLKKQKDKKVQGCHCTLGFGASSPLSSEEERAFYAGFQTEIAQASAIVEQLGKTPDILQERIKEITQTGSLPWHALLRGDLLSKMGTEVPTYAPPRRKHYPTLLLPSYRSMVTKTLVILVDVSASVGIELLDKFGSNVQPAAERADRTIVITFDQKVREVIETRRPKDILKKLKFESGAHCYTSTIEAFEKAAGYAPTATVILTDGYIEAPPTPPMSNILVVIPVNGAHLPWGRHYTMEYSW